MSLPNCVRNLKLYIVEDELYNEFKRGKVEKPSDFEEFCINHCKDIEEILSEYFKKKAQVKEADIDLTTVYLKGVEDGKSKYREQIEGKIEELQQRKEKLHPASDCVIIDEIETKIEVCEELLNGRGK